MAGADAGFCAILARTMATPRFHVDGPLAAPARVELPAAASHHALRVLRLRAGDPLQLFDGRGGQYEARLLAGGAGAAAVVELLSHDPVEREARVELTLVQALVALDKMDWVVEKAVELGVARLLVAPAERSVVRLDADRGQRRCQRWREIAIAACAQCGRNRLPAVELAPSLEVALATGASATLRLLLDPDAPQGLPAVHAAVSLVVGPEGGFTAAESGAARSHGYQGTRLGPRTLRTETAGLAATAALLALAGEFS